MTQEQILAVIQRRADACRRLAEDYRAEARDPALSIERYRTKLSLSEDFFVKEHLLRDLIGEIKDFAAIMEEI